MAVVVALFTAPASAQNRIASEGWEGFALRTPEDKFDRCVLHNRSIDSLNASPFNMLGLTRNTAGQTGLMVFYQPRALMRGAHVIVALKIDQGEPLALNGEVPSDFHVIAGPVPPSALAALRAAKTIEATTQGQTIHFTVSGVGPALEALETCVRDNAR